MSEAPRITLLTDFGTRDGYVGAMKGVMAAALPGVALDDITHEVPPGDVAAGALALARYWSRYPPGAVHLAVVDPGVGTDRLPLAVVADGRFLVLPDNGLVSRVLAEARQWEAVAIRRERLGVENTSATFHGRDLFAPAAAALARGSRLEDLGELVEEPVRRTEAMARRVGDVVEGEVVAVDRFGNLISNIGSGDVPAGRSVRIGAETVALATTYGGVARGELLALVNSDGRLEVAVREGSAAERLGLGVGTPVRVEPPGALDG